MDETQHKEENENDMKCRREQWARMSENVASLLF